MSGRTDVGAAVRAGIGAAVPALAGLENQLGGLKRRHTLIKQLEADGWPLVRLDLGGLTKRVDVDEHMQRVGFRDGDSFRRALLREYAFEQLEGGEASNAEAQGDARG